MVSLGFAKRLSLRTKGRAKAVTVANEDKAKVLKTVAHVPVLIEELEAWIDYIVLEIVFSNMVIGRPTLK